MNKHDLAHNWGIVSWPPQERGSCVGLPRGFRYENRHLVTKNKQKKLARKQLKIKQDYLHHASLYQQKNFDTRLSKKILFGGVWEQLSVSINESSSSLPAPKVKRLRLEKANFAL